MTIDIDQISSNNSLKQESNAIYIEFSSEFYFSLFLIKSNSLIRLIYIQIQFFSLLFLCSLFLWLSPLVKLVFQFDKWILWERICLKIQLKRVFSNHYFMPFIETNEKSIQFGNTFLFVSLLSNFISI